MKLLQSLGRFKYFLRSLAKSSLWFLLLITMEAVINLCFSSYTFGQYYHFAERIEIVNEAVTSMLVVILLGSLYLLYAGWEAVLQKNVVATSAVLLFHVSFFIYSIIQYVQLGFCLRYAHWIFSKSRFLPFRQINLYTSFSKYESVFNNSTFTFYNLQAFYVALPVVIGLIGIILCFLVYRMNKVYGWVMYQRHGPDLHMRRRYLIYEIFVALVKLDFYFCSCLAIQIAMMNNQPTEDHYEKTRLVLMLLLIPYTLFVLSISLYAVRKESYVLMIYVEMMMLAGSAYYLYYMVVVYSSKSNLFLNYNVYASLPVTLITVTHVLTTFAVGITCMINFGHGLREYLNYLNQKKKEESKNALNLPRSRRPIDD
ncbi:conserved fungal multispanning membrane protein [Schizosaccharomyces osmophilus]|uniref:Conserved fungal multispanning membrane protein n=1 Tax=Schizosaccharomyces osmophilus TaxID=2545709 RepID=A0AAE9WED7_9SCHI|nr:conserved fungal multispanning membrane protein [Schizosaccharomyces osmophilus]WBW73208.1 conserved fungal multispanning membrane protein [Schizosaccharomyces osmophilus]